MGHAVRVLAPYRSAYCRNSDSATLSVFTNITTFFQPCLAPLLPTCEISTMSLSLPSYLDSLQNNIRGRLIPWEGAVRAGTITEDQLSKIRAVDKVRKAQRKEIVEGDLQGYRTLFVGADGQPSIFESASRRTDVIQYILVLLGDLLEGIYCCYPYHIWGPELIFCRHSSSISSSC